MFVLCGEGAIPCYRGPAIRQNLHVRFSKVDHRFDREDHAGAHFDAFIRMPVVKDVRGVVEQLAYAMAAEIAHDRAALCFGIGLDGCTDGTRSGARLDGLNASQKALIRHFEQTLSRSFDLANRVHATRIAVPTIYDIGDVDVDDVAFAQGFIVWNAVANNVVDRGANRMGIAT